MKDIFFISERAKYGWLSNFAICPNGVACFGLRAPTVEHIYQAMKLSNSSSKARQAMCRIASAADAKAIGGAIVLRPEWGKVRDDIMKQLVRAKFGQNPTLAKQLVETGEARIIEDAPWDKYWGSGESRAWRRENGQNRLGVLLMVFRAKLVETMDEKQVRGPEDPRFPAILRSLI